MRERRKLDGPLAGRGRSVACWPRPRSWRTSRRGWTGLLGLRPARSGPPLERHSLLLLTKLGRSRSWRPPRTTCPRSGPGRRRYCRVPTRPGSGVGARSVEAESFRRTPGAAGPPVSWGIGGPSVRTTTPGELGGEGRAPPPLVPARPSPEVRVRLPPPTPSSVGALERGAATPP